jgi:hypothetical protein
MTSYRTFYKRVRNAIIYFFMWIWYVPFYLRQGPWTTRLIASQSQLTIQLTLFAIQYGLLSRDLIDPGQLTFSNAEGRREVSCRLFAPDSNLAVIFAFGQSNIANEGDARSHYQAGANVYNFDFLTGRVFAARDPLLGATLHRSNFVTRLGDLLVCRGQYERVLLVPIAFGGTYIDDWAPGGRLHIRLMFALKKLKASGIATTHVIFQQGEAESAQINADGAAWTRNLKKIVRAMRERGVQAPIYVAQCSETGSGQNDVIRLAQRSVIDSSDLVYAGPDLDVIEIKERWDGCHFSEAGQIRAAELWFNCLTHSRPVKASRDPALQKSFA